MDKTYYLYIDEERPALNLENKEQKCQSNYVGMPSNEKETYVILQ